MPTPREITAFLRGLRDAIRTDRVVVSRYALERAMEELGWLREDVLKQLEDLTSGDFHRRESSGRGDGTWIWVFCPEVEGHTLWIRITRRDHHIVISFHEA